jgi:hypothetical protein
MAVAALNFGLIETYPSSLELSKFGIWAQINHPHEPPKLQPTNRPLHP